MAGAAFGFIVPVAGALLQEIIDLAVIVNALRASKAAPTSIAATNREPAAARAAA
jgi:cation transport ATPase